MIVKIIEELFGKCLAVFGVYVFGGGDVSKDLGTEGQGCTPKNRALC